MPKNIEDIIPAGRRSIRNIPLPVRKEKVKEAPSREEEPVAIHKATRAEYAESPLPRRSSRRNLFIGTGAAIVAIAFLVLALQSGATLAYIPKVAKLAFANDAYTAHQTPSEGQLPFSVIKLSGEKSVNAPATGEENATEKASGRVVIYNEQSASQQLIKTTRLETSDGKIYRIQEDVTVPAKGNVEVTAVADQAGPTYNIPLSDFTIPGLKGTPKYELVYARSKTPMSGGFSGVRKKVSETDLTNARKSLEGSLRTELLSQARAQMPSDFILFPELASVTYEILPIEGAGENNAKVTVRGNLNAAIFKKGELAQYLAMQKLGADNIGGEVAIDDFSAMNITTGSQEEIGRSGTLRVLVVGQAEVRYMTDEVALASDLVGVPKKEVNTVLKRYPSIESASAIIRPFWKSSFPNDVQEIKIERN
jgi:hypothetical protein